MKRKTFAIFSIVLVALAATGQSQRDEQLPPFAIPDCAPRDRICLERKSEREKARNKQRQEDLKRDTDKLYQLATELKNAVDKTNENMLSIDVIRKTEESEKLAKNVRNKMKAE
jgi:hypothetical protein